MVTTPRGKFIWRRHLDQLVAGTGTLAKPRASDPGFTEGFLALPQSQAGEQSTSEEPVAVESNARSFIRDSSTGKALPVKRTPST
ncbi:hypothetical protein MTO96_012584 [Rhipicephalus appendiculatus]